MVKPILYKGNYIVPEWKCYTYWFVERYNQVKGKTLKKSDIDEDLMMCLELRKVIEKVDEENVHIKENTEDED